MYTLFCGGGGVRTLILYTLYVILALNAPDMRLFPGGEGVSSFLFILFFAWVVLVPDRYSVLTADVDSVTSFFFLSY